MTRDQLINKVAYVASFNPATPVTVRPRKRPFSLPTRKYLAKRRPPSERTELFLRKYSLLDQYVSNPPTVIRWLQQLVQQQPGIEEVHALAELAELEAGWLFERGKSSEAANYYSLALIHAYQFLFAPQLDLKRNAYDPQFRNICDIYNRSLESMLRQVCDGELLMPGQTIHFGENANRIEFHVQIEGRWKDQQFERFELVNDFRTTGLQNQYHTYGLGVPLIAIRKQQAINSPMEKYYPPELTFPMTAFCHFAAESADVDGQVRHAVLTLYDPLEQTVVRADAQDVPLESDITTPLAFHLRDPVLHTGVLETASLLNAEFAPEIYGMFMLEPYDPRKIPVVMVHGLWSSPLTWVHMFNDLRANSDIRDNYQFWFYSYPTGQPFWQSARQMRADLAKIRSELDPDKTSASLKQMILVGHSMGGLVSTMQTLESGDRFWKMVSDQSFESLTGDAEGLERLRQTFFFSPDPFIRRVITIASPFQGSDFANAATRWISQKILTLPQSDTQVLKEVVKQNQAILPSKHWLVDATSLDSLAPHAPIFTAMAEASAAPHVVFHNIYGKLPVRHWLPNRGEPDFQGDGVVSLESSHHGRAVSQLDVPEEHSDVHQHALCIYEVRRILLENLIELKRIESRSIPDLPSEATTAGYETEISADGECN